MIRKEFYKFKEIYLLFALLICAFLIYFGVKLRANLSQMGGVETNLIFLFQKGFSFYHITDLNLVFAASIAVFVFLRERINARLRLSLHFPRNTWVNIFYIVFTGFCFVVALYIVEILIFNLIVSNVYAGEIIGVLNCSLLQNFAFGLVLYLFCAGLIIEPVKKRVAVNFIVMAACIYLYYEINPDIYALLSFYANDFGLFYIILAGIYAANSTAIAFDNYKKGYIR